MLVKLEEEKEGSKTPEVHSLSDAKSQLQQAEDTADNVLRNKVLKILWNLIYWISFSYYYTMILITCKDLFELLFCIDDSNLD